MCSSERNGQITSGTRSSTGGSRRSPTRRSTSAPTPCSSASARATSSIPSERSTPITGSPGLRDRHGDASRADGELDDRAVAALRLLDVERDVLDDRGAPRVVDPGDGVVERHGGQCRAAIAGRARWYARPLMDADALEREGLAAAAAAASTDAIEAVRVEYLGRKSAIKQALREVRDRETGMALNAVRERLEAAIDAREAELARAELDARLTTERVDVTLPVGGYARGRLHLITQIRREVEDVFLGLGYTRRRRPRGRDDALQLRRASTSRPGIRRARRSRPSSSTTQTVLRTETSPSQIRTMEAQQPPVYIVTLGRVYRRDTPDATHSPIFHQVEGLAVDEGITLADLKGTLDFLLRKLFGEERRTEFRTHYFPFTEPSIEAYVSCHVCDGAGCPVCRHSGWIEVGGAGMVDPKLFEFVGYDPERYSGFAFGWGLERIAMLRHEFPDLRELWRNDLRFSRQF